MTVHPTLLGTRHGQSANILLLHFWWETMALDLLHELPENREVAYKIQVPKLGSLPRSPDSTPLIPTILGSNSMYHFINREITGDIANLNTLVTLML